MVKLGANLGWLFTELDFLDRFQAAADAGFRGVEYPSPYDYPVDALGERMEKHGLTQVLLNMPSGNREAGERGLAALPGREREFQDSVGEALRYGVSLGCRQLMAPSGVLPEGTDPDRARQTYVENLRFASRELAAEGVRLLLEPQNTRDIPGVFLHHSWQAEELIREAGVDNAWLQYDFYHMQIMEGDLAKTVERLQGLIPHFQIADNPGRHEPGSGEINFPFLLEFLDGLGYDGWVCAEYRPAGGTAEGLGWAKPYLGKA